MPIFCSCFCLPPPLLASLHVSPFSSFSVSLRTKDRTRRHRLKESRHRVSSRSSSFKSQKLEKERKRKSWLLRAFLMLVLIFCIFQAIIISKTHKIMESIAVLIHSSEQIDANNQRSLFVRSKTTRRDDDNVTSDASSSYSNMSPPTTSTTAAINDASPKNASAVAVTIVKASESEWKQSPVCQPNFGPVPGNITRMLFMHARKAGGTTIRRYLEAVARFYNLEYVVSESRPFEKPGTRNDTLYITHTRDPIKRTLSHYMYDQRWPCSHFQNKSFVPSLENELDFDTWFHRGYCNHGSIFRNLWRCVYNCYIRWLVNPDDVCNGHVANHTKIKSMYIEARKRAYNFNFIIHSEMLGDSNYTDSIERMLGLKGLTGINARMACGPESKRANKLIPPRFRNETLQELRHVSQPDIQLFNELTHCPKGVQFPSQSLDQLLLHQKRSH